MMKLFRDKTLLITGGTGSFGSTFIPMTLARHKPKKIIVYSRDEMKQWDMALLFKEDPRVQFVIGDVRDGSRLAKTMTGVNHVIHAAATKIVPTAEYNPTECIKTNVNGAMNVIEAAQEAKVESVVALSTDKACNPVNLYGATKLASDKLFVASNNPTDLSNTKFSVVRYGNVMGSRGSVIPFFLSCRDSGILPITDPRMTRFMISLEQGVELVWHAFNDMFGGEIYVKKIPSMNIMDIGKAIAPNAEVDVIGIRPGEKLHEQMVGIEDAPHTFEYDEYYKILPAIHNLSGDAARIGTGERVDKNFEYSSNNNSKWMSIEQLQHWIKTNTLKSDKE